MKIREAFEWSLDNKFYDDGKTCLLGCIHAPDDPTMKFYFLSLNLDEDSRLEENIDAYSYYLVAGNIIDGACKEEMQISESVDQLIDTLPDFVLQMKFKVYQFSDSVLYGAFIGEAIKVMFDDLPVWDEDMDTDAKLAFENAAIEKLNFHNA